MPPRPLPKKHLRTLRHRWRQLVDLSFDGNLTMAATVLRMPFSTVQQYYQKGPRRISAAAVKRIDEVTGVGEWVAGRDEPGEGGDTANRTLMAASGLVGLTSIDHPRMYLVPAFVCWRIERVVEEMGRDSPAAKDERIDVIFASIVRGIEIGLLQDWSLSGQLGFAHALDADGKEVDGAALIIRLEDRDGVRQVHKFCKFWEDVLGISAGPPKRSAARKRS